MQTLLMGGQACVYYGAAEFSKDVDFAVLADADILSRLQDALQNLFTSVKTDADLLEGDLFEYGVFGARPQSIASCRVIQRLLYSFL